MIDRVGGYDTSAAHSTRSDPVAGAARTNGARGMEKLFTVFAVMNHQLTRSASLPKGTGLCCQGGKFTFHSLALFTHRKAILALFVDT
jgi:hypothetical protein